MRRAENGLFISDAEGVNLDGSFRYPSRFIFNTDKEFLEYEVELNEKIMNDAKQYIKMDEEKMNRNKPVFQVGSKVEHKAFGIGKIVAIKEDISSYVIKFEKSETERSINFNIPMKKL